MRILSLDTSFSFFNFAVVEDHKVRLIHYYDSDKKTLQNLPTELKKLGIDPSEFDAFAVSRGVGYLTSLRIGITFMKTLSYLLKKPIISFENLELLVRYTPSRDPLFAYLKVSNNIFIREGVAGEVSIYRGQVPKGVPVSLSVMREESFGGHQILHEFFPFSAYGGLRACEIMEEHPEGEDPFSLEPLYLKPPA